MFNDTKPNLLDLSYASKLTSLNFPQQNVTTQPDPSS